VVAVHRDRLLLVVGEDAQQLADSERTRRSMLSRWTFAAPASARVSVSRLSTSCASRSATPSSSTRAAGGATRRRYAEAASIVRFVQSQLEVSVIRHLKPARKR
jgi:hypothetical protein